MTSSRTSNNLSFHGDAETSGQSRCQGFSESPQSCPLPDCFLNSPSSLALTLFLCSGHDTFLDILECSTWLHQALLYLDTSWSSFIKDPPPLWLANFFSSFRFQLNCHGFKKVFPMVYISLLSWSLSVDPSSCLACPKVIIHCVWESLHVHLPF